ncbi:MAG: hypothetical protein BWY57_01496 [Betaproteobacteria bacterium ADurb.Bin341]|nr:MAG: hypothetical protein BWY57_01496 [Betaproteobacteria bacterium ADurb.Bin341]
MIHQRFISFAAAIEQIREFCGQRRSGAAFLVSDDSCLAQVHLLNGVILSVVCRNKKGNDALAIMRDFKSVSLRFDDEYVTSAEGDDLSTDAFFKYFGDEHAISAKQNSNESRARKPSVELSPELKHLFQRLLAKYIGPIAEIVCEDHYAASGDAVIVAEALAHEIPNPENAAKFRAEVAQVLAAR